MGPSTRCLPTRSLGSSRESVRGRIEIFDRTTTHYNYFRDYDPAIGRYVESDPIGLWGGLNIFAYVYNSPLRFSDPLGLDRTTWIGGANRWGMGGGPRNGNWCGGDWSGGQMPSAHGGKDGTAKPMDSLDTCCMKHDQCYSGCENVPLSARGACIANCDRSLVGCLKDLNDDCSKWASPPRKGTEGDSQMYRDDTIRWFTQEVRKYDAQLRRR